MWVKRFTAIPHDLHKHNGSSPLKTYQNLRLGFCETTIYMVRPNNLRCQNNTWRSSAASRHGRHELVCAMVAFPHSYFPDSQSFHPWRKMRLVKDHEVWVLRFSITSVEEYQEWWGIGRWGMCTGGWNRMRQISKFRKPNNIDCLFMYKYRLL